MRIPMPSWNNTRPNSRPGVRRRAALAALALAAMAPISLLTGCMTPEDKAFYGRGWLNPSELDEDQSPPPAFQDTPASAGPEGHVIGPVN